MSRALRAAVVACLCFTIGAVPLTAASQTLPQVLPLVPPLELPPPPDEVRPALGAPSPAIFQACQVEGAAMGLLQVAAAIGGLPINPTHELAPVRALSPLGAVCAYFRISVVPPRCEVDNEIPPAPVSVPRPASTVAAQVRAIEKALNDYGAGLGNDVSGPVYEQLGCR